MLFTFAFNIDKDVIEIHYHDNVKFLYQNLVDIVLECGWSIDSTKKYYLVLEMTIAGLEGHFLFIAFINPYLIVGIGQIKLRKTSSLI